MRSIRTVKGQTVMDIAIQEYGNYKAIDEILSNNPNIFGLNNFEDSIVHPGQVFDIGWPIFKNVEILIDDDSPLMNKTVLRSIGNNKIISE